jgi:radical SAM superfamily enzyme YgiQ (UPF0313 family)
MVYLIFGLPGETLDNALETVVLAGRIKADSISPTIYQPIVNSELWRHMKDNDLFEADTDRSFSHFSYQSPVKMPHKREIMNLHKIAFIGAYHPALLPVLRFAIRLPPNPLFAALNYLNLLKVYRKSRAMSFREILTLAWHIRSMK